MIRNNYCAVGKVRYSAASDSTPYSGIVYKPCQISGILKLETIIELLELYH